MAKDEISEKDVEDYKSIMNKNEQENQESASGSVDSKGQKRKPSYHKEGVIPQA